MTKRKEAPQKKRASEKKPLDLLPREKAFWRTDDLLRTMLNSPPKPRTARAKPEKRAKK